MLLSLNHAILSLILFGQVSLAVVPPKREEVQKKLATVKSFSEIQGTFILYKEDAQKWMKSEEGKLKEDQFSAFGDLMMEVEALSAIQIWTFSPENCKSRLAYLKIHFSSATALMTDVPENLRWIRESAEQACTMASQ